ncbi:unnamed protein product [Closterium sp. NIES-54]
MLRSDRGGEFLGRAFSDLVEDKGILHNLTCPYTLQQNGMAEQEMRTVVEAMRTMLLHMGVKHHCWHLTLRQADWVRNCLERASLPSGTTLHQLLFEKKPNLMLARVVSTESKGQEVLDLTDNKVVTTVEAILYGTLLMEMWKVEYGPASTRTPSTSPTDTSSVHPALLAADDKLDEDDVDDITPSPPPPVQGSSLAAGDEGRLGVLLAALTGCIAGGQRDAEKASDKKRQTIGESLTSKKTAETLSAKALTAEKPSAEVPASGEPLVEKPILGEQLVEERLTGEQFDDDSSSDVVEVIGAAGGDEGELWTGEQSDDSDVVEVAVEEAKPRRSARPNIGKPPEKLGCHARRGATWRGLEEEPCR